MQPFCGELVRECCSCGFRLRPVPTMGVRFPEGLAHSRQGLLGGCSVLVHAGSTSGGLDPSNCCRPSTRAWMRMRALRSPSNSRQHARTNCLNSSTGRRSQSKLKRWEDFRDKHWQRALLSWGHEAPASIADVEHTHSTDNVVGGVNPAGGGFVFRACLKDGRLLAKAFKDWRSTWASQRGGARLSGAQAALQSRRFTFELSNARWKRAFSAFGV